MIAEEVENGEEDGSNTSSKIGNTSSAAAILRCGGRTVKQEVFSASSKRDVWACEKKDPLPMSNFWERAREADSSNDGPKLWIKSQYSETVKLKEDVPEARTI